MTGRPRLSALPLQAPFSTSGTVVFVFDGDTVKVKFEDGLERRVRLIGADAPELDDQREKIALWAQLAKRFAFFHLSGRRIRLTYDFEPLDKHGRVLAYIWTDEGRLFNELMIARGFGHAFLSYPFRSDYQRSFREAETEARNEKRGLWRDEGPEAVSLDEARPSLGDYVSIRFTPAEISENRFYVYLSVAGRKFEALIPRERRTLFPSAETLRGKELVATGLLEEFKGRLQIILFFPCQLISVGLTSRPG
ncbi:MAG: thermonuclease family protein [Acidobacteriota bacterium]